MLRRDELRTCCPNTHACGTRPRRDSEGHTGRRTDSSRTTKYLRTRVRRIHIYMYIHVGTQARNCHGVFSVDEKRNSVLPIARLYPPKTVAREATGSGPQEATIGGAPWKIVSDT